MEEKINEVLEKIQKILVFMIPEEVKDIKLYATVNESQNYKGELFFYYKPKKIFNSRYINCYEIPAIFDIEEQEFSNLISKLYNYILILNDYNSQIMSQKSKKNWNNITIVITSDKVITETSNINFKEGVFSSYERHIIWRNKYLGIKPKFFEEKQILKKYFSYKIQEPEKEKNIFPKAQIKLKNIVQFDKVLTLEEAMARKTEDELKNRIEKSKLESKRKNKN